MEPEELEAAKAKLIETYPDFEAQIKAVDCEDKLKDLEATLTKPPEKPKTFEERFAELESEYKKEVEDRMILQMEKKVEAAKQAKQKVTEENFNEKLLTELGAIKAKMDEFTAELATVKTAQEGFREKFGKLENVTAIKGFGVAPPGEVPSLTEQAMAMDPISNPKGLMELAKPSQGSEPE
jgi:ATP-dependent exoDNAse (exonuclease V) beta subunit